MEGVAGFPPAAPAPPPLHPAIAPLSFLLGKWRGQGEGGFPTINSFAYAEELLFSHSGKPLIEYNQKTWKLASGEPMHAESGYWRPKADGSIEVIIAQSTGLVEVQKGSYDAENKIVMLQSELVGNASKLACWKYIESEFLGEGNNPSLQGSEWRAIICCSDGNKHYHSSASS